MAQLMYQDLYKVLVIIPPRCGCSNPVSLSSSLWNHNTSYKEKTEAPVPNYHKQSQQWLQL